MIEEHSGCMVVLGASSQEPSHSFDSTERAWKKKPLKCSTPSIVTGEKESKWLGLHYLLRLVSKVGRDPNYNSKRERDLIFFLGLNLV